MKADIPRRQKSRRYLSLSPSQSISLTPSPKNWQDISISSLVASSSNGGCCRRLSLETAAWLKPRIASYSSGLGFVFARTCVHKQMRMWDLGSFGKRRMIRIYTTEYYTRGARKKIFRVPRLYCICIQQQQCSKYQLSVT